MCDTIICREDVFVRDGRKFLLGPDPSILSIAAENGGARLHWPPRFDALVPYGPLLGPGKKKSRKRRINQPCNADTAPLTQPLWETLATAEA